MKIYIINSHKSKERRLFMSSQLKKLNCDFEFIQAIDGCLLSNEYLESICFNYKNSFLTKNEIGCALSHIKVYKKIVSSNINSALILEDDIKLNGSIQTLLSEIEERLEKEKKSTIITLGKVDRYSTFYPKYSYSNNYKEYTAIAGLGGYAYVINNKAANSLIKNLVPIKYEADCFRFFRENGWINQFNVIKPLAINLTNLESTLSPNRIQYENQRRKFFKAEVLKKRKTSIQIKSILFKLVHRVFTKKCS